MRWAPLAAAIVAAFVTTQARAELPDPADAAARANEVNQTYCGNAYSSDITLAADSMRRVAETWSIVNEVYEETDAPYLLYWRGVLAQCLGRPEHAHEDLGQFVTSQKDGGAYADLVRQAKVRLRRLGRKRDLGDGPIAHYLRSVHWFEGSIGYRAGLVVQSQACTDVADISKELGYLDGACLSGSPPVWKHGLIGQPAGIDAAIAFYPTKVLGGGGRFTLDATATSDLGVDEEWLPPTEVGPMWTLLLGPVVRLQKPVSSGSRGLRLQLMPAFYARHERTSPLAGALNMEKTVGLTPAGTYGWTLPGLGGQIELSIEASRTIAVRLGAIGGGSFGRADPDLRETEAPSAEIVRMPDATSLGSAGFIGGHFGLLIALGKGDLAFAPALNVSWRTSVLGYPDPLGDEFRGDEDRRVYSTRQDLLSVTLDLALRFGVAR